MTCRSYKYDHYRLYIHYIYFLENGILTVINLLEFSPGPSLASTTCRFNRTQQPVAPQLHAVFLSISLRTNNYNRQAIVVCFLHDVNCIVKGHPRYNLHQYLDNIFSFVKVVVVQYYTIGWSCFLFFS